MAKLKALLFLIESWRLWTLIVSTSLALLYLVFLLRGVCWSNAQLQDLLYKHLDTTVGASFDTHPLESAKPAQLSSTGVNDSEEDVAIRLFRRAPPGIVIQRSGKLELLTWIHQVNANIANSTKWYILRTTTEGAECWC